jgi:hypothetical protein
VLDAKTALDVYPADGATASSPLGTLHFGSFCHPTSPKTQELKARYEALHTTENKCADSDLMIVGR